MCISHINNSLQFVPKHNPVNDIDVKLLSDFLVKCKQLLVVTGAGISTESGIPDYRSDGVGLYARSNSRPIQFQNYIKSFEARKRYWARNYVGWDRFSSFKPNITHNIVKALETDYNKVSCVITQNVDNLHNKAGSDFVIELHGTAFKVICLSCNFKFGRHFIQDMLKTLNPNMTEISHLIRPDGDVELSQNVVENFTLPLCPNCNGVLKPDIVFFGENVPRERVTQVDNEIDRCDSVLMIGTSLSTFSGYRIAIRAKELNKPLALINIGSTRADSIADIKFERRCGELLSNLQLSSLFPS